MPFVASLGMYDGTGARPANDLLWRLIAETLTSRGVADIPVTLDRQRALDTIWGDPHLLFAQCCGYPLVTRYRERLRVIAVPRYTAPGCQGARHRSRIVVRVSDGATRLRDLRNRRAAVNDPASNSGMNLFRATIAPLAGGDRFFAATVETGSHVASLLAVADGTADVAAIDTVSFAHAERDMPELTRQVRTLSWTISSPALPFVTSIATPKNVWQTLRNAFWEVVASDAALPVRKGLMLSGLGMPQSYDETLQLSLRAVELGYPLLT